MNVSQQEYETKYREYLERVNRRNSLRRLLNHQQQRQPEHFETDGYDDFADEAGLAEQRFLYSFPNSGEILKTVKGLF